MNIYFSLPNLTVSDQSCSMWPYPLTELDRNCPEWCSA